MKVLSCSQEQKINFNGKLIIKGSNWTDSIKESLNSSQSIKDMIKNHDVVIRSSLIFSNEYDVYHSAGTPLLKLKLSILKENSFKDKVKDFFDMLPRVSLTEGYHSVEGTIDAINNEKRMVKLKDKLLA